MPDDLINLVESTPPCSCQCGCDNDLIIVRVTGQCIVCFDERGHKPRDLSA